MINSVTSSTSSSAAAETMKSSIGMNSGDFLKLFIAQLQNQDPLSPQDPAQFLGQLSQLTQVEQAYNTNTALAKLILAENNLTSMNSSNLIGKTVKANGNSINFDGTSASPLQYNLSGSTGTTTVKISNSAGNVVRTVSLGAKSAGDATYTWDGCDNNGIKLSAGAYKFAVSGANSSGTAVTSTTYTIGKVDSVSLSGDTPTLIIGNTSVSLTDIINVKG